ncbi:MAG: type II 3-dehydroquinate dehydratase [Bacillota bacterium]|nr:type II 3-dehydroquinate dehydratase [Bacillota bacterium]
MTTTCGATGSGQQGGGELVLVLHGPSLGALGSREPAIYGRTTLAEIDERLSAEAAALGALTTSLQSNHEGTLIDAILAAPERGVAGILINPAAYTHTSLAIADALRAAALPAVEVHLTQTAAREPIRRRSLVAPACAASVAGFGPCSYTLGLRGLLGLLRERANS